MSGKKSLYGFQYFLISFKPEVPKNTCGIFIIQIFLPQTPKSDNMWENVYISPIANPKFSYLKSSSKTLLSVTCVICVSLWLVHDLCDNPNALYTNWTSGMCFWTLCFLNSFSKRGCYMEQRCLSHVGADILDDGLQVPVCVSSLNNGTALCDSKVEQYIVILNVSLLSITLSDTGTAQNLMHKCQKFTGRFMKPNWAPSSARSWQTSLMWHCDVTECHQDWLQTDWMWSKWRTSSI